MTEELKMKRTTAKGQFSRSEKRLKDALQSAESIPLSTLERRYEELSSKWERVQEAHDTYVAVLLASSTDETTETEEEEWINGLAERFDAIEVDADRTLEALKQKWSSVKTEANSTEAKTEAKKLTASTSMQQPPNTDNSDPSGRQPGASNTVQLERIKLDKFDGDIRKYPKFREQFELYVKPLCTPVQLPFVLRSHLVESVREEVDNEEDNLDTLWSRLDKKYGNCGKLVDAILADIAKAPRGDGSSTVIMINTVERAYRDLSRLGKENEMKNGTICSMIKKELPEEIRFEWIKLIAETGEDDAEVNFMSLLELLKKWRTMIEYDQATIKKPSENKSITQQQKTHKQTDTCWIHTSEKHPIWVCQSFKAKPLSERLSLVKQHKACQACLEINCQGAVKAEDCKKGFKCTIQGCSKPHNRLLHP